MPRYSYRSCDANGKIITGQRNADSEEQLAEQLMNAGLTPLEILQISSKKGFDDASTQSSQRFRTRKVPLDEMHMFCRQMYALTHAGIPVATSIGKLAETTHNTTLSSALKNIVEILNKGSPLHVAMGYYPKIFSGFFVNLIVVGERTGNLDNVFLHLAEYLDLEVDSIKKIKTALRYPVIVIIACVLALLIVNIFVIPAFAKFFDSMHGTLPLPTRVLMATSSFIINYWYIIAGIVVVSGILLQRYIHTTNGQLVYGRFQLKIPIIGWLIHRILLARFARLLALVLRSGVTASEGIQMVSDSTNNSYVAKKIKNVTELIVRGNTISTAIEKTQLFPPLIVQMISLGEESGTIDTLLDEVADYYQREINYDIVRLSDLMEPILLSFIGGIVLILALGIYLPMWQMASLVAHNG